MHFVFRVVLSSGKKKIEIDIETNGLDGCKCSFMATISLSLSAPCYAPPPLTTIATAAGAKTAAIAKATETANATEATKEK